MNDAHQFQTENFFRTAFWAVVVMLIIIPVQILVFALSPHPTSVQNWLELFGNNWLLGVIHFDGLYIINNIILAIMYAALFILMVKEHTTAMVLALLFGLLGITSYFASNKAVEMFFLGKAYHGGEAGLPIEVYLASTQSLLLAWKGTAFDIYYILNGLSLFLISYAMLKSRYFTKTTAIIGLISAFFMMIPSNFGTVGLLFSLVSLIPWYIFAIMIAQVFAEHSKNPNE